MADQNQKPHPQPPGRREQGAIMREKAVKLRAMGLSYSEIGEQLGVTKQTAHTHVRKALLKLAEKETEAAKVVKQLELVRLDQLLRTHWPSKGRVENAKLILEISKRRARLEGLDAPERQEVTGKDGAPLHPPPSDDLPGLDNLTDEQLTQLQELLRLAGQKPTPASEVEKPKSPKG